MARALSSLSVLLFGLLFLPAFGAAQLRIVPQAGLYSSVSDLGTVNSSEGVLDVGENETSLALGLSLEMISTGVLGFRLTGLYGTDSEVPVGGIGCEGIDCELRSTVLGLSASAVLRPVRSGFPLLPYLVAGGGLKRYDFDFDAKSPVGDAFDDESKLSGALGLGFDWNLGIVKGNLELVDFISESVLGGEDLQHDFFLTVGLFLG